MPRNCVSRDATREAAQRLFAQIAIDVSSLLRSPPRASRINRKKTRASAVSMFPSTIRPRMESIPLPCSFVDSVAVDVSTLIEVNANGIRLANRPRRDFIAQHRVTPNLDHEQRCQIRDRSSASSTWLVPASCVSCARANATLSNFKVERQKMIDAEFFSPMLAWTNRDVVGDTLARDRQRCQSVSEREIHTSALVSAHDTAAAVPNHCASDPSLEADNASLPGWFLPRRD